MLTVKNQAFYLPLKNTASLLRSFNAMADLKRYPTQALKKKNEKQYLEIMVGLCKWVQRSLEIDD